MMEEKIRERIERLTVQRAQLAQALAESRQRSAQLEANLLQHDGAITELSALLKSEEKSGEFETQITT